MAHPLAAYLGYRALSVDYCEGTGRNRYEFDAVEQGPVMGQRCASDLAEAVVISNRTATLLVMLQPQMCTLSGHSHVDHRGIRH
jgi:hypothetical protein